MSDFEPMTREEFLATIPDNGTWLRRVRRWNARHSFILSLAIWAVIIAIVVWIAA